MPIDPSIALGVRPLEVPNPLNQLAQVSQIQSAQRQGEVAQMKLEDMIAERKELNQFAAKIKEKGFEPRAYMEMLATSRNPEMQKMGIEGIMRLNRQDKFEKTYGKILPQLFGMAPEGAAAPAVAPTAPMQPGALGTGTFGVAPEPTQTNALAPTAAPTTPTAPVNQLAAPQAAGMSIPQMEMLALQLANEEDPRAKTAVSLIEKKIEAARKPSLHVVPGVGLVDVTGKTVVPSVESTPSEIKQYEYAKKQGFTGSIFDFKRALASAGRAAATPSAPVAVVDETGKTRYVSREEAIGRGMTPASAYEGITPKEIQKREAALPAATSAVKGFEAKSESFVKDLKTLRDHPGLSEITGFVAGRVPGLTANGRAAQALYDKVVAKGGFQALQDLRDASKTGGALGNVSNQEGKQLTASFAAIDRRQDVGDVQSALDAAIADVEGARTRMREVYDDTYKYKSGRAAVPGAGAGGAPDPLGIR